ncbi:MAG TPA: hypothetical protein PLN72_14725, partial [bacterium]|nr:hypothetical protein [bacterium]
MKYLSKSASSLLFIVPALLLFSAGFLQIAHAQKAELYEVLFGEKDKQLKSYKNSQADLLSP